MDDLGNDCLIYFLDLEQCSFGATTTPEEICSKIRYLAFCIRRLIVSLLCLRDGSIDSPLHLQSFEQLRDVVAYIPRLMHPLGGLACDLTHNVVAIFETLLSAIKTYALAQACVSLDQGKGLIVTAEKIFETSAPSMRRTTVQGKDRAAELCRLLLSMLTSLNPQNPSQCEVFERFLTVFLHLMQEYLEWAFIEDGMISRRKPSPRDFERAVLDIRRMSAQKSLIS